MIVIINVLTALSGAPVLLLNCRFRAECSLNRCVLPPETEKSTACCLLAVCVAGQMFQIIIMEDILEKLSQSSTTVLVLKRIRRHRSQCN